MKHAGIDFRNAGRDLGNDPSFVEDHAHEARASYQDPAFDRFDSVHAEVARFGFVRDPHEFGRVADSARA